jgi:hypothetical protein
MGASSSVGAKCALILAIAQEMALRSVQRPSSLVRWFWERSGALVVSPTRIPIIRDSRTSVVGRLTSYKIPRPEGPPRARRGKVLV